MRIRLLLTILLFPVLLIAQDQTSGGVELPEFVITGSQSVSIPIMKKKRPQPIAVLNQEFFLPAYAPDNLTLNKFNYSLEDVEPQRRKEEFFGGVLQIGGGLLTYPDGIFMLDKNVKHVLIHSKLWGFNVRDYVKYSNYNESGGNLGAAFYLSKKSPFMPGMKIATSFDGMRNSFYLYGSKKPSFFRESDFIAGNVQFQYAIKKYFNYNLTFSTKLFELKEIGLKDYSYSSSGYLQYRFPTTGVRFDYKYLRDEYKTNRASMKQSDFMYGKLSVILSPFNSFNAKFGMSYAKLDTNIQIVPSASFQLKLDEGIYLFGEYAPYADYKTFSDFFAQNRFVNTNDLHGKFLDYSSVVKLAAKFEYKEILDVSTGLEFQTVRNLPYFEDVNNDGKFEIRKSSEVSFKSGFLQALLTSHYFGNFYFKASLNDVRNIVGNLIPYYPLVKMEATYSYFFHFGLTASAGVEYFSDYYTNVANKSKIKNYLNVSLDLNYKLLKSLEVVAKADNLLNWKNYRYYGYLEKTNDVLLGLRYRF